MGAKKDNRIVVSFLGGSSTEVTGSCVSISYPKHNDERGLILIELGLIQGQNTVLNEYIDNKKMIENVPIKDAEFIFINHAHQDHEGNLGAVIPNGFKGRIISNYETIEISKKLLPDTAYIHRKNVEYLNGKGKKVKSLYTEQDAYATFDLMDSYEVNEMHILNEYISFCFRNNSHVVGAVQLELFITKPNGVKKKILYTSDLGSPMNKDFQPFLKDNYMVSTSNLAIFESTYGCSERSFTKKEAVAERKDMMDTIKRFVYNENRVFIPCFSFGRTQNMMCQIYEWFKDEKKFDNIPVVVDSKLANDINSVYKRILNEEDRKYFSEVMSWKNFKFIKDYQSTITFLSKRVPCIVLSSSGMITAGHSLLYAKSFLGCSKDAILFCGYCGEGSVGAKILNNEQKTVSIDGAVVMKNCFIKKYSTFSSHAQQGDLINYMKHLNSEKIILHHGSEVAKRELQKVATEELRKVDKTTNIVVTDKNYQVTL